MLVSPDATRVVLGPCDDRIAFVVERARKYLVSVTLQLLKQLAGLGVPESSDLIVAYGQQFGALGVEDYLRDVLLMAYIDKVLPYNVIMHSASETL